MVYGKLNSLHLIWNRFSTINNQASPFKMIWLRDSSVHKVRFVLCQYLTLGLDPRVPLNEVQISGLCLPNLFIPLHGVDKCYMLSLVYFQALFSSTSANYRLNKFTASSSSSWQWYPFFFFNFRSTLSQMSQAEIISVWNESKFNRKSCVRHQSLSKTPHFILLTMATSTEGTRL